MKLSLIATLVIVLAVAHGTQAMSLANRDVKAEVERITKLIKGMSTRIATATQDMVEKVKALEVTGTAQTYMEYGRTKIQPLVEKVQVEAAKLQGQVKPFITNIKDQITPLPDNFNTQVKPLTDNFHPQVKSLADMMENFFKQVVDQTKALLPPQ